MQLYSLWTNFPFSYPRSLCKVFASTPVLSDILWAALPVGAAKTGRHFFALRISQSARKIVVLPVPGPPVIMLTLFFNAAIIALVCSGAKSNPARDLAHSAAFSNFIGGSDDGDF